MPKTNRKVSAVPEIFEGESEIAFEMRVLKQKNDEMEKRLNMVESKLNDLSEQFMEEFGEDYQEEEEEEKK
ncbi:hypothetical protein HY989_01300 [Candidatus Micrarchaeota archaeon]|nr:hypothetical protein [Candidatus Micrarchaeota archaeon]